MTYFEKIVNIETGETTERPYTAEEIQEIENAQALANERLAEAEARATARAAILDRLGLTAEEAALLLS